MYLLFVLFPLLCAAAYTVLMRVYARGWRLLPEQNPAPGFRPELRFSVVIPARNEAQNIGACLHSVLNGAYPADLLEIIVIDDDSDDGTAEVARRVAQPYETASGRNLLRVLRLQDHIPAGLILNSHKKAAIELAVSQASGDWIATTDADCIVPPDWLLRHAAAAQEHYVVTGPVLFDGMRNVLQQFQALDFAGMMGITGAGIRLGFQRMGNGANLAYKRSIFEELGGFEGNTDRASGDDMFFIQKVAARYPDRIAFVKHPDAAVRTAAVADLPGFIRQRIRWGAKNAALPETTVKLALACVYLCCCCILGYGLGAAAAWLFGAPVWARAAGLVWLLITGVKALSDYFFLRELCRYFRRMELMRYFWPSFFMHCAYIALLGTASLFVKKYAWKGRKVR